MTGAANRRKGCKYEVELTHYLGAQLDCQVISSRNGRGGTQGLADLMWSEHGDARFDPGVRLWSVEAKDVKNKAVPTWLRQAAGDAHGPWYVVLHRTPGTSDRSQDRAYLPRRMLLDWLLYREPTVTSYDPDDYLELTAGQWCEVAS